MHLDHAIPEIAWTAAAVPPVAAAIAFAMRGRLPGRAVSHVLAAAGVSLLLYSLSGPRIAGLEPVPRFAVLALDSSDSIGPAELARAAESAGEIARLLSAGGVSTEMLAFDSGARRVSQSQSPEQFREDGHGGAHNTSSLAVAMLAASGAVPSGSTGRVYLFSDGRFSDLGTCTRSGLALPVYAFPLAPRGDVEVRIDALDYSRPIEEGTPARVWVTLLSNAAGSGLLTLEVDGAPAGTAEVSLTPGVPLTHAFPDLMLAKGTRGITTRFQGLEGMPDALPAKSEARVGGPPKVLLVDCPRLRGLAPLKALEAQEFELHAITWDRFGEVETLEEFDAVLICPPDDPAGIGEADARLARFVTHGGGLMIMAGRTGFGPGWEGTALAAVSPVRPPAPVPPPPDEKKPDPEE